MNPLAPGGEQGDLSSQPPTHHHSTVTFTLPTPAEETAGTGNNVTNSADAENEKIPASSHHHQKEANAVVVVTSAVCSRRASHASHSRRSSIAARARSSSGGGGKVRESYAAALWNPMPDADKEAFNRRRLLQLFAGVMIATCGGSAFAFGIFSNRIKAIASLSQSQMTTITTTGSIMGSFTFPAGMLFDYYGPNYVLAAGTLFSAGGFALLALIFEGIVTPSVYSVAVSKGLTSIGSGFFDTGSLMSNLFNFPINRGDVLIIQKTFFGLGSTFFSIIFDGFFAPTHNFLGYATTVAVVMFLAGTIGTAFIRLPPFKRTTRELKRIAALQDPIQKERERLQEERYFEMYHNPRLTDRRRLNAGIFCLVVSLIFFSVFSIGKTYIDIPNEVILGLTFVAILCVLSFTILFIPIRIPAFFDFEFLPDFNPPESLVDKPSDDDNLNNDGKGKAKICEAQQLVGGADDDDDGAMAINNCDRSDIDSVARGREYSSLSSETGKAKRKDEEGDADFDDHHDDDHDGDMCAGGAGRASSFLPTRASMVDNSAPIAVPEGLPVSMLPSIQTTFLQSLLQPMIWCMWIIGFTKAGVGVIVGNQAQIMNSANDGEFDQKNNSLAVALLGIGSALGRILIGMGETYYQRKNALAREEQLAWIAVNGPPTEEQRRNPPPADDTTNMPDMRPITHRWGSTVVCLFPVFPAVLTVCVFLFTFAPVSLFPIIFVPLGAAHGGWISIGALAIREMYSKDVAKHYSFTVTSGIVASLVLNRAMFGTWFDEETEKHPAADGYSCAGYSCFSHSLYVIGGICAFSTFLSGYTAYRWWMIRREFW